MNILLLGSGGREHTFAWKITQSPLCNQLFIAPGNAGTASHGINVDLSPTDFDAIAQFALERRINMVVVGPEAPLVNGIYNYFQDRETLSQVKVIGPSKAAAMLEGSKAFAKKFMADFDIPTASYREFTHDTMSEGLSYIESHDLPVVLKADGLAAGKGVLICQDHETAATEFKNMLEGKFGEASRKVVIEQFLDGLEFSVFALTDGEDYKILPVAKDYKRIGEGDTGLNTGGMGAVSPVPFVDEALMDKVQKKIIRPTIRGLRERNLIYTGFLFFGLIRVNDEPYVIEYNCRMGDPETQVVFPRIDSDLVALMLAAHNKSLEEENLQIDPRACTAVVMVSGGYPQQYRKGKEITGLPIESDNLVFHAGTTKEGRTIHTNGGRVLAVSAYGSNIKQALDSAYEDAAKIHFENAYYRRDIGFDLGL